MSTTDAQWLTVREAGQLIRAGDLSPVELTTATLDSIEKTKDVTKAFVCLMADQALKAAQTAERELREGIDRGPLTAFRTR